MKDEDQQVATEGAVGRVWDGARSAAAVCASIQSQEVHPESNLRLSMALKDMLKLDYRGVWQLLLDTPDLCAVIELKILAPTNRSQAA